MTQDLQNPKTIVHAVMDRDPKSSQRIENGLETMLAHWMQDGGYLLGVINMTQQCCMLGLRVQNTRGGWIVFFQFLQDFHN